MDRIIRLRELKGIIGLGHSSIYQMISEGRFPKQIKLSERAVGWRQSEIEAWLTSRQKS